MRLTKWQRFWKLDVPGSMIGLVWNGMMSFGGGWFFLTASEAITVNKHTYALPGIGSYVAAASARAQLGQVLLAIVVMIVMVVGVNFLFWRPLVAWSEKFRNEQTEAAEQPRSLLLDTLRRSPGPALLGPPATAGRGACLDRATRPVRHRRIDLSTRTPSRRRAGDTVFAVVVGGGRDLGRVGGVALHPDHVGLAAVGARVRSRRDHVLAGASSSSSSRRSSGFRSASRSACRHASPATRSRSCRSWRSFPANFLFPFAAAFLVATSISLNGGGIVLMALGAQWYILFNTIAGAMAIPSDLREAMDNFGVRGWQRWRRFILPGDLPVLRHRWDHRRRRRLERVDRRRSRHVRQPHPRSPPGLGAYIVAVHRDR